MWEQLCNFVIRRNLDGLVTFLTANPTAYSTLDQTHGINLLHYACIQDRLEIAEYLLKNYPKLNEPCRLFRRYPLHYACRHETLEIVERLLQYQNVAQQLAAVDRDGKTPFLLAIDKNKLNSVRLLLAPRYLDLMGIEDLKNGLLELLKQNHLDIAEMIVNIIQRKKDAEQIINVGLANIQIDDRKQPPLLQPTPTVGNPDQTTLQLIDLFLSELKFQRWLILKGGNIVARHGNRDDTLDENGESIRQRKEHRERRTQIIRRAIDSLYPELRMLSSDLLSQYYQSAVTLRQRYFGDNSDDSDSDDEMQLTQVQDLSSRIRKYKEIQAIINSEPMTFWFKSCRNRKGAGLVEKLYTLVGPQRSPVTDPKVVKKINKSVFKEKRPRQMITEPRFDKPKRFVAQFRGINYMHDRWSVQARRYHYKMDETGYAQFSEAALKTLPFNFYTELNKTNDFYKNPLHYQELIATAQRMRQLYYHLHNNSGLFVEQAIAPKVEPYIFNGITDWMQHQFTNGISNHLLELKQHRIRNSYQMHLHTLNAFNYAVSTSDCPAHSLRYALGLKDYYADNFELHYNADGSIVNSHVGKAYIILQEVSDFLKPGTANHVLKMAYEGRVPIIKTQGLGDIANELENDFVGYIPGENVVYQKRLKFPSFNRPYKSIYEIKYGMDRSLYDLFSHLIQITWQAGQTHQAGNIHMEVLKLLKEWLCSYYELILLEVAQRKANDLGGSLVYVHHDGTQQQDPGFVPFNGGDTHIHNRNRVHVLQNFRYIAARLPAIHRTNLTAMINQIFPDPARLHQLSDQVTATPAGVGGFSKITDINEKLFYGNISTRLLQQCTPNDMRRELDGISHYILNQYQGTFAHNPVTTIPFVVNLRNSNYLYNDTDINILLNQYRDSLPAIQGIRINAAQHPFIQGEHARGSIDLFREAIRQILTNQIPAIIPINTTTERSSSYENAHTRGTHWVGIVFRPAANNQMVVEYIDPFNVPNPGLEQLTRSEIETIARQTGCTINFILLPTNQQADDLDCGPWMIDNMVQRMQNLPLRTQQQITGANLRIQHFQIYNTQIQACYRRKFN